MSQPITQAPVLVTDVKSAELIKHASNSFLALKISYINAVAQVCADWGVERSEVEVEVRSEGDDDDQRCHIPGVCESQIGRD